MSSSKNLTQVLSDQCCSAFRITSWSYGAVECMVRKLLWDLFIHFVEEHVKTIALVN